LIEKSKESCKNAWQIAESHFAGVSKKVRIGSEAEREIDDILFTRQAIEKLSFEGKPGQPSDNILQARRRYTGFKEYRHSRVCRYFNLRWDILLG